MTAAVDVRRLVEPVLGAVTAYRHALHQAPELALQEHDTAAMVRRVLAEAGVPPLPPFLGTDVVALLRGAADGPNVTLRADMDALPIQEQTGLPYASRCPGRMHACGHDGHTAMLLGAALVLSRARDRFRGSVRFVFQPGEELVAAGRDLVAKGALLDPEPAAVLALHTWNGLPVGVLSSKPGPMMAASDFFTLTIRGRGGHGSKPDDTIDPILTAARVVDGLQAVVSRNVSAHDPVVVSVCRIQGGVNGNVIPETVEMEGTTRFLRPALGPQIQAHMHRIIKGVCDSLGASYSIRFDGPYIPTINDAGVVALGQRVAERVLGPGHWRDMELPTMGSEDFSYYLERYPGAMFRLGNGEASPSIHHPRFDFSDAALGPGIAFLVGAVLEVLGPA